MGAWIETVIKYQMEIQKVVAPHVGAWIETSYISSKTSTFVVICRKISTFVISKTSRCGQQFDFLVITCNVQK